MVIISIANAICQEFLLKILSVIISYTENFLEGCAVMKIASDFV